jgi:maltose alpha-D-glucosyltransferase/alpha-amylase
VTFPRIGELSYLLTLPGHGFYWFQLPAARDDRSSSTDNRPTGAGGHGDDEGGDDLAGPRESHQQ